MNLDPAKLLVILVVGLLVLGPERLPRVARQLGSLWREFTVARDRLVDEIKEQVPDLPRSTSVRSMLNEVSRGVMPGAPPNTGGIDASATATDSELMAPRTWVAQRDGAKDRPAAPVFDVADPTLN